MRQCLDASKRKLGTFIPAEDLHPGPELCPSPGADYLAPFSAPIRPEPIAVFIHIRARSDDDRGAIPRAVVLVHRW